MIVEYFKKLLPRFHSKLPAKKLLETFSYQKEVCLPANRLRSKIILKTLLKISQNHQLFDEKHELNALIMLEQS